MTRDATPGHGAHVWTDPTTGTRYLLTHAFTIDDTRVYASPEHELVGWRVAFVREPCTTCGGWTRLRDPDTKPRHPGCFLSEPQDTTLQGRNSVTQPLCGCADLRVSGTRTAVRGAERGV